MFGEYQASKVGATTSNNPMDISAMARLSVREVTLPTKTLPPRTLPTKFLSPQ